MVLDRLQRVQIGRFKEVPIETNTGLWFLLVDEKGNWEACTNTDLTKDIVKQWKIIFCVWHGNHRTNLFLMDKQDLIKRLQH